MGASVVVRPPSSPIATAEAAVRPSTCDHMCGSQAWQRQHGAVVVLVIWEGRIGLAKVLTKVHPGDLHLAAEMEVVRARPVVMREHVQALVGPVVVLLNTKRPW